MVEIFWPAAAEIGVMQERIASPFRCTVQAPHRAAPQPNLVPVMLRLSRSAQRMGVEGSASTCWSRPLMFRVTKCYSLVLDECCFLLCAWARGAHALYRFLLFDRFEFFL